MKRDGLLVWVWAVWALFACLLAAPAVAAERFPQPEFESGYAIPTPDHPDARWPGMEWVDAGALLAALSLAAFLALKTRSRIGLFLLMLASLAYFGFYRKGCVCSVGSIQNMALMLFDGGYAVPLSVAAFFLLPLAFALLFGRVFCAAVCPLGAVQDAVVLKPVRVPAWLASALGMLPVVYLGAAVLFAATGTAFLICRYDPFVSLFRRSGSAPILAWGAGLLILGVFVARPYCRFLCPYGVLLGWMSRLSPFHATITPDECVRCRLCEDSCPFDAIEKPAPEEAPDRPRGDLPRLAALLALAPLLAFAGGWLVSRAAAPLAAAHPAVSLARQVALEESDRTVSLTKESEAFRGTGRTASELFAEADAVRKRFSIGGWIFGAFLGLAFGGRLVRLFVGRKPRDYEPDRGACVSCGRCFETCPRERRRKSKTR